MGMYYVVDDRECVTYDGCIETHEDYLLKQSALSEAEWEWLDEFPEYSFDMVWAYIERLNIGNE